MDKATGEDPINYIVRHMNLDPGALGADDRLQNLRAVREGRRVFSAYELLDGSVAGQGMRAGRAAADDHEAGVQAAIAGNMRPASVALICRARYFE